MKRRQTSNQVLSAARSLQAEGAAKAVIPTLRSAGAEPVLLKGPAVAAWLYPEEGAGSVERTYGDLDLLVDPAALGAAETALAALGYERGQGGWDGVSHAWRRSGDEFAVDLHSSIVGADAAAGVVWRELSGRAEERELVGVRVRCLDEPGLAMHVATHCAQHGLDGDAKPSEDLRRALAAAGPRTWSEAAALAERIGAGPAFAAGLRREPEGVRLAAELGLGEEMPVDVALRATEDPPPLVLGLEQMRRIDGTGARLHFVLGKVFPTRAQMRSTSSLAARGSAGLAAAYAARPFRVAWELPRALARHRSLRAATAEERAQHVDDGELGERDERQGEAPRETG